MIGKCTCAEEKWTLARALAPNKSCYFPMSTEDDKLKWTWDPKRGRLVNLTKPVRRTPPVPFATPHPFQASNHKPRRRYKTKARLRRVSRAHGTCAPSEGGPVCRHDYARVLGAGVAPAARTSTLAHATHATAALPPNHRSMSLTSGSGPSSPARRPRHGGPMAHPRKASMATGPVQTAAT